MNGNQKIGLALVVLAGVGGLAYFQREKDKKIGTAETTSEALPEIKLTSTDDITKIAVTNADKSDVVLEKVGEKWELAKPVKAPANQANIKSLLDNLKELKADELISKDASDDLKKTYDLTPEKAVHVVLYKGDTKTFDATFGKSGGRGQMAIVDGKAGIYGVKGYSSYHYARETKGWRDTEIFKFDDANVTDVTIQKKDGKFHFAKSGDKFTGTLNDKAIERFDAEKVKDVLRALKSLAAEDFGDGKSAADTGLDQPESTTTVQLKDGPKFVLKTGKVATGTNRYAQREGDATTFVIAAWPADWVTADVSKFQTATDAGVPKKDGGK